MAAESSDDRSPRAALRIERGAPTAAELAALVVVLGARSRPAPAAAAPRPSRWADKGAMLGLTPAPGPGAWRSSAQPR